MLQAHPDHGGTTEALQEALGRMRAENPLPLAGPAGAAKQSPHAPSIRTSLWGIGKSIFYVYFVVVPILLAFGLLFARINDWLF